jgi:hypothetical protein
MASKAQKVPKTAQQAEKNDTYSKVTAKPSAIEKKKWVMLKQKGKWQFAKAASATASGPHTVCYYDPNTGFYDDCHTA